MNELMKQIPGNRDADGSNGVRIMPLGTDATLSAGSPAAVWGLIIQDFRSGLRGKNGSARQSGTHKLRCKAWHDDETRANPGLHSDPGPVPASVPHSHAQ